MRAKHERRVEDDLRDHKRVTRKAYLAHTRRGGIGANLRIFHAEKPLGKLIRQPNEKSRAGVVVIPDQSQLEVSVPKLDQRLRTVTRDTYKLAEEEQLDPKPAKRKGHLPRGQQHAGELGQIFNVYRRALALCVVELLLFGNNFDNLRHVSIIPN
jgi:hypothetical protein